MISGILIAVMMVLFLGLVAWAWSSGRREDFNEAAQLPLVERAPARREEPRA
ncbi:MAG: cbb3-type cytochrome c oxidase subunit 3 [Lysobacteraceae bacterium]|jgi:cytochrome c oxidase cbb3-type subunit 4|nr:MAG: cbb3-type cytochrome c oxidase subunit 3 [Xanthomonadaceae bacterium]